MKKTLLIIYLILGASSVYAQSCDDVMELVKSKSIGTTYNSYNSDAISKVTFYTVNIDFQTYYFAIVCFKRNEYSFTCDEYIYQVASNTKWNYSINYYESAGNAFWEHIQPYATVLGCSPNFN